VVAAFCVLVAATALNVLTGSVFLAIDRVWSFLRLNGVLMGALKIGLPFALAGAGAFGLYGAVGLSILCCGVASLAVILRHVPGSRRPAPSPQLLANRGFAAAGYVTYVLTVLPLLVFPLLVVNALGSAAAGAYFISFQVAMLLNALVLAVSNATYAETERAEHGRHAVVRKGGLLLIAGTGAGCLAMLLLAPYLLAIFGSHYVDEGTSTLRVLALGAVGAAFNYWGMLRLRLAANLVAMVGVQLVSTVVMLVLAVSLVHLGTVWVAAAWGFGHAVGGLLGYLLTATVVPFSDDAPARHEEPAPA
jgi:O-antigen/teichoic acid export membrane protein